MGSLEPEVFVVVPSHNHAAFIQRCLRSIIGQTMRPKKLLVIDDGSQDGSQAIIEKVLNDCPFDCEFVARENRGLCATLNQGLEASAGDYFAYLGSDDLWLPGFLREQTSLLESRPDAVLAFSHAYVIDEDDRIVDSTDRWTTFADRDMRSMLLLGTVFSSPGVLYRQPILMKHRWNEKAVLEDYEMYLRLSAEGEFARNEKTLCAWRRHGENASDNLPVMYDEMIAAQDRLANDLGIPREELDDLQTRFRFKATVNLVRHGFRREAARWFLENLAGASSVSQIVGNALRIAVPRSLFQWNSRRRANNAARTAVTIDDVMRDEV